MGSGGGGGGGNPEALYENAAPMEGLPVAGAGSTIGSPWEYGQFQNFLPEIPAEGPAPSATGLKPDMFQYKSPSGVVAEGGANGQIEELRAALAKLQAAGGAQNSDPNDQPYWDTSLGRTPWDQTHG